MVVEETPEKTGEPDGGCLTGRGTEAETLERAGVRTAVGLVAGTDNDANNLSIIMTAQEINPDLFLVARQNLEENESLFEAVKADVVMHPSSIIANKIRVLLGTPLLYEFMSLAMHQDDGWSCELVSRIVALVHEELPEVWELEISTEMAHAVHGALESGRVITVCDLISDSRDRDRRLLCIPLLLRRGDVRTTLPEDETYLKPGDRLLVCGRASASERMSWTLQNEHALSYILTGEARPQGWVWQALKRKERVPAGRV